jgi:hypothetical protein
MLYGSCNGYFGRDSYKPKRIEALGADWVVVRNVDDDKVSCATFNSEKEMMRYLTLWSKL